MRETLHTSWDGISQRKNLMGYLLSKLHVRPNLPTCILTTSYRRPSFRAFTIIIVTWQFLSNSAQTGALL